MKAGAALIAATLLIGCKSPVAPLSGDVYVLDTIEGRSLPTTYADGIGFRLLADTIAFDSDGTGERRTLYESYSGTRRAETTTFAYTRTGDNVAIAFDCPAALCQFPPQFSGTLSFANGSSILTITTSKTTFWPLVFRRFLPD